MIKRFFWQLGVILLTVVTLSVTTYFMFSKPIHWDTVIVKDYVCNKKGTCDLKSENGEVYRTASNVIGKDLIKIGDKVVLGEPLCSGINTIKFIEE